MFARMKVGTRLALAFGVVVLLLGAMLAVSLTRMKSIQAGLLEITDVNNEELRAANAMNDAAHDALINLEGELLSSDLDKSRRLEEVRLEAAKRFETRDSRPTASETAFAPAHGGRKPQPLRTVGTIAPPAEELDESEFGPFPQRLPEPICSVGPPTRSAGVLNGARCRRV